MSLLFILKINFPMVVSGQKGGEEILPFVQIKMNNNMCALSEEEKGLDQMDVGSSLFSKIRNDAINKLDRKVKLPTKREIAV